MDEQRLPGGRTFGAVRTAGAVHRAAQPWTATVHAVLRHLEASGFTGAPRVLGSTTTWRRARVQRDAKVVPAGGAVVGAAVDRHSAPLGHRADHQPPPPATPRRAGTWLPVHGPRRRSAPTAGRPPPARTRSPLAGAPPAPPRTHVHRNPGGQRHVPQVGEQPVRHVDHRGGASLAATGPAAYGGAGTRCAPTTPPACGSPAQHS